MAKVALRPWATARLTQFLYPFVIRVPKDLHFATRPIAKPKEQKVQTRHGKVRVLIYRPHSDAPLAKGVDRPPVHVEIHGGGFVARDPHQDDHICDFIASEVGAVVVSIDYSVAPQVQYPVSEEQCIDVVEWVARNGDRNGWDGTRISVLGISAGGKHAITVAQLAYQKELPLRALILAYAAADMTRTDRTSAIEKPMVPPRVQQLAADTYFAEVSRRTEPLASPIFDAELAKKVPPTLILTGEYDTLGPEMDRMAENLAAASVEVTHHMFPKTDHGFLHFKPVETAREAMEFIRNHLIANLAQGPGDES
jgi:acetyl esterase